MRIPNRFAPLAADANQPDTLNAITQFLTRIWAQLPPDANTFLAYRQADRWKEQPIAGDQMSAARNFIRNHPADEGDLYFCLNGFSTNSRKAEFALNTCLGWCDIDDYDPKTFEPRPNILWETSAGRYQGIWMWGQTLSPEAAEQISRGLLRFGGDKGGWSITKMLRIPGTLNHKPERNRDRVRLLRFDDRPQPVPAFPISRAKSLVSFEAGEFDPTRFEVVEVIKRYRRKVSLFARTLMEAKRQIYPDRSEAIYVIVSELVAAGAEDDQIGCVMLSNPHFLEKHGDDWVMAEREIVTIRAKLGDTK